MPPSSPPPDLEVTFDELPPLSEQGWSPIQYSSSRCVYIDFPGDVAILYHIVSRAQQNPDADLLPVQTLWSCYDAVLAENGINKESDRVLLRFIFRLADKSLPGGTLYHKFELLLEQLGFQLVWDDEEPQGQNFEESGYLADVQTPAPPRRRASFSTVENINDGLKLSPKARKLPDPRQIPRRSSSRATTRRTERAFGEHTQKRGEESPRPDRMSAERFADISLQLSRKRSASRSRPNGSRHVSHSDPEENPTLALIDDLPSGPTTESSLASYSSAERVSLPPELHYRPSLTRLIDDADVINRYRIRDTIRKYLRRWRTKTTNMRQDHSHMLAQAVHRDKSTLLKQAFDIWNQALHQRQEAARTERFFAHLENKASKARDLFLMTKAFTHWAEVASDEAARTSVARRHVLRAKYFDAWRSTTAVNEIKVERLAMKRPFLAWKRMYLQRLEDEAAAVSVYHQNLTKLVYWRWFWKFCDRHTGDWRDARLKRRTLVSWIHKLRLLVEKENEVVHSTTRGTLQAAFLTWKDKAGKLAALSQGAEDFRKRNLLRNTAFEWSTETRLAPIERRMGNMLDWRIAGTAFQTWHHQISMGMEADRVRRLRILQAAFTHWNDQLRVSVVTDRINERIAATSILSWVMAERSKLAGRVREQRCKRAIFETFVKGCRTRRTRLLKQEQVFLASRDRGLLDATLDCWKIRMATHRQREDRAIQKYGTTLKLASLQACAAQSKTHARSEWRADQMHDRSLAQKTLRIWCDAASRSGKQRRRDAYVKVRRQVKMNLASAALNSWRVRVDEIRVKEEKAAEKLHFREVALSKVKLDEWRDRHLHLEDRLRIADSQFRCHLLARCIRTWMLSIQEIYKLDSRANELINARVSKAASAQLRKLSLTVFQLNTRWENADAMQERNFRKHIRNMFRYWYEKGQTRRALGELPGGVTDTTSGDKFFEFSMQSQRAPRGSNSTSLFVRPPTSPQPYERDFSRTEIQASGAKAKTFTATSMTPGYLNSPSRRLARAKALERVSTTPATPRGTPFAARLRLGMGLGGSILGSGSRTGNGRINGVHASALPNGTPVATTSPANIPMRFRPFQPSSPAGSFKDFVVEGDDGREEEEAIKGGLYDAEGEEDDVDIVEAPCSPTEGRGR